MTYSLRGRLFIGLTLLIVVVSICAGALAFRWAFDEAIEMQDSILTQIAGMAINTRFENVGPINRGVDAEAQVIIKELGDRASTSEAPAIWPLQDGLHLFSNAQGPWRILLRTRPDGSRFFVGQPTAIREEIARDSALHTILPLTALIPCLMLVITFVIARSVRPVVRLAQQLDARGADDLTRLPLDRTPRELHPFIASINRLLERIQVMMDQQRRFVAEAAHELRTPITALTLQAENLDQVDLSKEGHSRLAVLKKGARRTKYLLDQLLVLARYDMGRPSEASVTPLDVCAKEVVADLLPDAASRGIDLGFDVVEPMFVNGEPIMLAAIVRNLLDNALRFTPRGGRIDVGVYREDGRGVLTIRDTGPGIPVKDLERVFEPFFRGSRPAQDGTGLGLSIVKRIADQLGGSVTLKNVSDAQQSGLLVIVSLMTASERKGAGSTAADALVMETPALKRRGQGALSPRS